MSILFQLANLFVLPFWALMIFLPRWQGTRKLLRSPLVLLPLPIAYVILLAPWLPDLGPLLANPKLSDIAGVLGRPEGALIGWIHFLALDLFVGRWIYLDSRDRNLSPWLMAPILFLTLMAGPCGLLVYLSVCLFVDNAAPGSPSAANGDGRQGGQNG